ncbi:MAG: ribose 5-phosphate isomerase B [Sphingobacteriia bacterium]|nr:ribose 5-phosphate isomerase B [Sphingobacteriia bacterium]
MSENSKIYLASDHAGFKLKEIIKEYFIKGDQAFIDLGTTSEESCDYPDLALNLCERLESEKEGIGILICGSGIGMSIAANRYSHIRAALCINETMAKLAREHNNANVLVLGARLIDEKSNIKCVETFINTAFEGGRHIERVNKLTNLRSK